MRGRRRQRGATLLPYPFGPLLPRCCVSLSFLPYVFHNNVFRNTIFPTSLPSLPAGEGKHDSRWRENVDIRLSTFFFTKEARPFRRLSARTEFEYIFIHYFITKREKGRGECDECWKHRAFSLYRGICNLMEFAGNINKPSKRFPN